MKTYQLRKGFTLVEMLIVIAIIAILASVALVSVRGVRSSANDTKRLSDMNKVQQKLEVYYSTNGKYPNTVGYSGLAAVLGSGQQLPIDPGGTANYLYTGSADGQHYILQATLTGGNKIFDDPSTISSAAAPAGTSWVNGDTVVCAKTSFQYCIGQ